ncbi:MAG: hypothetical protein DCF15_13665 [Phormidesmis priestleyi]|uniref:Uncharacterized protein n=1 Tax=Phormidesmis priestleyi TaxID=268141 RepID=A0A2W4Z0H3_9CYAN|nr:MAG: hypothetical protein DCF15_13665 [Phormidesmis priestleyi]
MGKCVYTEVPLSYIYATAAVWNERYMVAVEEIGWNKRALLSQVIASYCFAHREYYQAAAWADAQARGFKASSFSQYFDLCSRWEDVPEYLSNRPEFEPSPLSQVIDVGGEENRRSYNGLRTSALNSAMLRVATFVERANAGKTVSRILQWHFDHYWSTYQYQLLAAQQHTFSPTVMPIEGKQP